MQLAAMFTGTEHAKQAVVDITACCHLVHKVGTIGLTTLSFTSQKD